MDGASEGGASEGGASEGGASEGGASSTARRDSAVAVADRAEEELRAAFGGSGFGSAVPEPIDVTGMLRDTSERRRDPTGKGKVKYPRVKTRARSEGKSERPRGSLPPGYGRAEASAEAAAAAAEAPGTTSALGSAAFIASTARADAVERRRRGAENLAKAKEAKALRDVARRLAETAGAIAREDAAARERAARPSSSSSFRSSASSDFSRGGSAGPSAAPSPARSALKKRPTSSRRAPLEAEKIDAAAAVEVEDTEKTNAAATALQSAYRGRAARREIAENIARGILRPSTAGGRYKHASGRHITFSETVEESDGVRASVEKKMAGAPDEEAENRDEARVDGDERSDGDGAANRAAASPPRPPPKPRLLEQMRGPPETHTVLPDDEHVPRSEDWLAMGGVSRARRLAKRRPAKDPVVESPTVDPRVVDAMSSDSFEGRWRRDPKRSSAAATAAAAAAHVLARSRTLPPRRVDAEPSGVLAVYAPG